MAAAPGVFYVFRDTERRVDFLARRFRRPDRVPPMRMSERLLVEHRDLLGELATFLGARGRGPEEGELAVHSRLVEAVGSIDKAHRLLLLASDPADWDAVRKSRSDDLLVYLALAKFDHRPGLSGLPLDIQRDVRAFFGSYAKATALADELLFALGDQRRLDEAAASSAVEKLLPMALYVHVEAIADLPMTLRLYEGCARAVLGEVEGATIVKFRRDEPKISYLCYPDSERDPHPCLVESVSVHLQTFRIKTRRDAQSANPPILHRKEAFVSPEHPMRERFAKLTRAEERAGLYEDTSRIGLADGWREALERAGVSIRGHRLLKALALPPDSRWPRRLDVSVGEAVRLRGGDEIRLHGGHRRLGRLREGPAPRIQAQGIVQNRAELRIG